MCRILLGEAAKKLARRVAEKFGKVPPTEPGPTFHFAEDGQLEEIYDYIPTEDSVERECNENPPRAPAPPPTPPSAKTVYTDPKEATRSTSARSLMPMPRRGASTVQKLRDPELRRRSLFEEMDTTSSSDPIFQG